MTEAEVARYTYDTEFVDDGETIKLISIGIVCLDDDRRYYAVNRDVNWDVVMTHSGGWLRDNVVPHLPVRRHCDDCDYPALDLTDPRIKRYRTIAKEVESFLTADGNDPTDRDVRELWAYYASYDHVALAQLWGPMIDLPSGIPMFTRDIKDWHVRLGRPELPKQASGEHDALTDALHNETMMRYLDDLEAALDYAPIVTLS